jgi:hypothetical protein
MHHTAPGYSFSLTYLSLRINPTNNSQKRKREEWSMLNSDLFEECDKTQVLRRCPEEIKNNYSWVDAWK